MQLVKKILGKLNGLYYPQEYLCLAKESFKDPIHVYLVTGNKIIKDITNHHLFVGYSPLIFAMSSFAEIDLEHEEDITLLFAQVVIGPNEIVKEKDALARIGFKKMKDKFQCPHKIYFYEGEEAWYRFTNSFHQFISRLNNDLHNKKPGNVFLGNNLYRQVQIAYAVPRIISLITINRNNLFNLFPTDLHGQVDAKHYIISLRHGGRASAQVALTRKILLTQIESSFYKTVYSLGKNHMQELKEKGNFPFSDQSSAVFQMPLPQHASSYRELSLIESFDRGIHRVFLFEIANSEQVGVQRQTLAHIHNVYATWRHNNGLSGNYLLR